MRIFSTVKSKISYPAWDASILNVLISYNNICVSKNPTNIWLIPYANSGNTMDVDDKTFNNNNKIRFLV